MARRWTISVAQSCSLRVEVGRQVKTARRLSVSEMPVTLLRPGDRQVLQVRHRGDAVGDADLGVGQRVVDRRDQIVDRALELLQERRGHAVRAGRHVNRRRLQHQAGRALVHLRVDRQQRPPLAVDRHLDLLVGRRRAEQEAVGVAVQVDAEDVVAVGREGVHHRDAAAGAERRAVDALQLRGGLRHAVVRLARPRRRGRPAPVPPPCWRRAGSSPSAPARRSARRRRCRSPG